MENKNHINHEEVANTMMTQVRQMVQTIPGFAYAVKGRRRAIITSASAPDDFLEATAVACDTTPQLAASENLTSTELRDCMSYSRAYTSLANEMLTIARGILDSVAECRHDLSKRARRFYKHAKALDQLTERELLVPHLENMQRALRRGRPSKRSQGVAKPDAPAPVAPVPAVPIAPPKTGGGGAA
jgi:hypothetical protein